MISTLLGSAIFGRKHIIGLVVSIIAIVVTLLVCHFVFRNKSEKTKIWVLRTFAIIILVVEFIKQTLILSHGKTIGLSTYPINLCHTALIVFPLVAFGGQNNKFANFFKPYTFCIPLIAGIMTLVYPSNVLGDGEYWFGNGEYLPIISFIYHSIMIIFPLYMVISKFYKPKPIDALWAGLTVFGYSIFISIYNVIVKYDFCFLGDASSSPFKFIYDKAGWFGHYLLLLSIGLACLALIYLPTFIKHWKLKSKLKNQTVKLQEINSSQKITEPNLIEIEEKIQTDNNKNKKPE